MKEDTVITARTKEALTPGLLVKECENWKLYKATRHLVVTDARFYESHGLSNDDIELYTQQELESESGNLFEYELAHDGSGREISYKSRGRNIGIYVKCMEKTKHKGKSTGYLCVGEKSPRRHFQSIFEKGDAENSYGTIQNTDMKKLEAVLEIYRNESVNKLYPKKHKGYLNYEHMKSQGVIPVYYQIKNGKLYMSFAALGRKAFNRMLNDVVSEKSHQKCYERKNLCPACALFGTVEGEGMGSRISFTDASCTNYTEDRMKKNVVFAELGSPRMSYLPFYLKAKNGAVDYRDGYDAENLEIRGRKFYWHHEPELNSQKRIPVNERNATFDVLKPNTEFEFRVYFDQLSGDQLAQLASAVHLNDNNPDGNQCHKIGHGKPLGYGSVKMTVDRCMVRKFDVAGGWKEEPYCLPEKSVWECSEETAEALKIISDFTTCERFSNAKVEYPGIITDGLDDSYVRQLRPNDTASHKWFTENYKVGDRNPKYPLPEIKDIVNTTENETLFKYKIVFDEDQEKSSHSNGRQSTRQNNYHQNDRRRSGYQEQERTSGSGFKAKVLTSGKVVRDDRFLEYEIQILNDDKYGNQKCILSAPTRKKIEIGYEVDVVLYRGTVFNLKR